MRGLKEDEKIVGGNVNICRSGSVLKDAKCCKGGAQLCFFTKSWELNCIVGVTLYRESA